MITLRWCLAVLTLSSALQAQELDAKALFVTNCASCHGETGDGKGWTELDRPARSFRDGGFSYGNTPDALFRTITYGIPGTPMPSFESSLTVAQREALAGHVVSLGPPIESVDPEQTVMRVVDQPRIVRGYLPPITDGAKEQPRGLLLGRPEGFTFEYRVDDVRMLGIRQGAFVERRDWTGRGGSALAPLGVVVLLVEDGDPRGSFRLRGVGELQATLTGSWVRGADAGIDYSLEHEGAAVADVTETPLPAGTSAGAGYSRRFNIIARRDGVLTQRLQAHGDALRVDSFQTAQGSGVIEWTVRRRSDGMFGIVGIMLHEDGRSYRQQDGVYELALPLTKGATRSVFVMTMVAHAWNDEVRARFVEEVAR